MSSSIEVLSMYWLVTTLVIIIPIRRQNRKLKRGNEAPPLPADTLGVHDPKTGVTAIQVVIIIGFCPILQPWSKHHGTVMKIKRENALHYINSES